MTPSAIRVRRAVSRLGFALVLLVALLIANVVALPSFANPHYWPTILAEFAPLALVAMASTPAILTRGVDLSVSPVLIFVNIVIVKFLLPHGWSGGVLLIPICVLSGAAVGVALGVCIAYARLPAVLVTLAALFVLTGVDERVLPNPISESSSWLNQLGGSVGPIPGAAFTIGVPLLVWLALDRSPFRVAIRAVGSSDGASLSAGLNVNLVRVVAYALGGAIAAIGGVAYTALVQSADSSVAQQYTVLALAAVGLGGTSLAGGYGGLGRSLIGASCVFLIQELLSSAHVPVSWVSLTYGAVLLVAIVLSSAGSGLRTGASTL